MSLGLRIRKRRLELGLTFNQGVWGSNPQWITKQKALRLQRLRLKKAGYLPQIRAALTWKR